MLASSGLEFREAFSIQVNSLAISSVNLALAGNV